MSAALVIEDPEPESRGLLELRLPGEGFRLVSADDPATRPDLVLLGDATALERWTPGVPTIVLGAPEADALDRVRAFRQGADDWVDRPFDYEELVERIRAVLRRAAPGDPELVEAGPVRVELATRRVSVAGERVHLAQKEFELLCELARDPERVFTKAQLLERVWRYPRDMQTRTLDSHASRLRRKLRAVHAETELVVNRWGVGYSLLGG